MRAMEARVGRLGEFGQVEPGFISSLCCELAQTNTCERTLANMLGRLS